VREGKPLTDVMLLQEEIAVPRISGDLDAIVLKALRRDPAARYASVELLDEDILAHLEHRPVKARAGTWRYLAGRFAVRHKLPLATAVAVLVTLVAGLVMAERERRVAVAEKARAERHFASVRKLANTFIFEVHAKIENLPGSLEAREMLIKTSLEYLDAIALETGRDPVLTAEIAAAYRNIGNIQGQAGRSNKGDFAGSVHNFEKGKRLYVELEQAQPGNIAVAREYRKLSYSLTRAYVLVGDPRWQAELAETLRLSARVASAPGATVSDRSYLPLARAEQAYLSSYLIAPTPETVAALANSIGAVEALVLEAPADVELRERLAAVYQRAGMLQGRLARTPQDVRAAIALQQKAQALVLAARAESPADASKQALAVSITYELAMLQRAAGDFRPADRSMVEALALSRDLYARDPANADVATDRIRILAGACHLALKLGDLPRAIALAREALAIAARLPEQTRKSTDLRVNIVNAQAGLGYALFASAGLAGDRGKRMALLLEARSMLAEAMQYLQAMRAGNLVVPFSDEDVKNFEETVKRCDAAIARLEAA
jgi:hypothetical protein